MSPWYWTEWTTKHVLSHALPRLSVLYFQQVPAQRVTISRRLSPSTRNCKRGYQNPTHEWRSTEWLWCSFGVSSLIAGQQTLWPTLEGRLTTAWNITWCGTPTEPETDPFIINPSTIVTCSTIGTTRTTQQAKPRAPKLSMSLHSIPPLRSHNLCLTYLFVDFWVWCSVVDDVCVVVSFNVLRDIYGDMSHRNGTYGCKL